MQANPRSGPAGSNLGLSGFVPSYDEAGEYDPNGVRVSFWWGLGQDDWIKVVSSSRDGFVIRLVDADVADPSVIRLAEADVADRCTYAVQAIVPDVTPGQYPITGVYFSDDGGAAALRTEIFTVTGG